MFRCFLYLRFHHFPEPFSSHIIGPPLCRPRHARSVNSLHYDLIFSTRGSVRHGLQSLDYTRGCKSARSGMDSERGREG